MSKVMICSAGGERCCVKHDDLCCKIVFFCIKSDDLCSRRGTRLCQKLRFVGGARVCVKSLVNT